MLKIAHLADIHIRNTSRFEEYDHVFKNLYNSLKEQNPDYIFVVGDIFHQKQVTSPESTQMAMDFFDNLRKISKVVITIGNHDLSVSSKDSRIDAITPIYNYLKFTKTVGHPVLFLKDTQKVDLKDTNVTLFHYSFLDDKTLSVEDKSRFNIGLYHGIVAGSRTDGGHVFDEKHESRVLPLSELNCTMLGDIHKFQVMEHNTVYPSSLVCQNFGEHPTEHGYVLWNIDDKSLKFDMNFVQIHNDYSMFTVAIDEKKQLHLLDYEVGKYKNPVVRVFYHSSLSRNEANEIISTETDITNALYRKSDDERISSEENKSKQQEIVDLYDKTTMRKYVSEYFEERLSKDTLEEVMKIHDEMFVKNSTKFDKKIDKKPFMVSNLSFSNTFCYGENNTLEFDKLKGVIGLFAKNRTGKSSLLNTIPFSMFGNFPRMGKLANVFNNNSDNYSTQIELSSGDDKYRISRKGKRTKKTQSNSLVFEKYINEEWIDQSEDAQVTNEKIRLTFGDLESYLKTAYIYQNSNDLFLNLKPSERKDWIASNLGLEVFDILHTSAKIESEDIRHEFKYLSSLNLYDKLSQFIVDKQVLQEKKKLKQKEIATHLKTIETVQKKIDVLKGKIKYIEESSIVPVTKEQIEMVSDRIKYYTNLIQEEQKQIDVIQSTTYTDVDEYVRLNQLIGDNINLLREKISEDIQGKINTLKEKQEAVKLVGKKLLEQRNEYKEKLNALNNHGFEQQEFDKTLHSLRTVNREISLLEIQIESLNKDIESKTQESLILSTDTRFLSEDLCKSCPLLKNALNSKNEIDKIKSTIAELKKQYDEKNVEKTTLELKSADIESRRKQMVQYDEILRRMDENKIDILSQKSKDDQLQNEITNLENSIDANLSLEVEKIKNELLKIKNSFELNKNSKIEIIQTKINGFKQNILEEQFKLKGLEEKFEKYELIKVDIERNRVIEQEIISITPELNEHNLSLDSFNQELNDINNELYHVEREIENHEKQVQKLKDTETKFKVFQEYIDATHRDAIPLSIISKVLNTLEFYVNEVLSKVADFTLNLFIENDNIEATMTAPDRGTWTSDLLSGMETFMVNLSFRIGVQKIANLNVPNFMVIDEGFSALDSENSQRIPELFEFLKSVYDFIIVVSHNDYMHDFTDYTIEINRIDDKSYISY